MESYEFEQAVKDTRERLKSRLPEYLRSKGLPDKKGKLFRCLEPDHEDRHPSMALLPGEKAVFCYSRKNKYDIFDLIGWDYNITDSWEQLKKACELFHEPIPGQKDGFTSYRPSKPKERPIQQEKRTETKMEEQKKEKDYGWLFEQASQNRDKAKAYLESRGIDGSLADVFNIGFFDGYKDYIGTYQNEQKRIWPALIIPCNEKHGVVRNTDKELEDPKGHRYRKLGESTLFAEKQIDEAVEEERPLFVAEGELDCLSIISVGGKAISPGSANNIKLVTEAIKKRIDSKKKLPLIVIALDNDNEGKVSESDLLKQLQEIGCPCYGGLGIYGKYKDANEALQADKDGFMETILQLQTEEDIIQYIVQKESMAGYVEEFLQRVDESANKEPAPTGFSLLDSKLDGGLYEEGLYILGAAPATGKTALALQIADTIAERGRDVFFFALEMSKFEMMARSISRLTYLLARDKGLDLDRYVKSTRGVSAGHLVKAYDDDVKKHLQECVSAYIPRYGNHFYLHEAGKGMGTKEIREIVERRIKKTGRAPVVFVDYLQILRPEDLKADMRLSIDLSISSLKRLARDYKLPVFLISSLNRMSYEAMTGMSGFKESSGVEYTCDCAMVLTYEPQYEKDENGEERKLELEDLQEQEPRKLILRIVKDRNGMSGAKICFDFYSRFNYFKEAKAQKFEERRKRRQQAITARQESKEKLDEFQRRLKEIK